MRPLIAAVMAAVCWFACTSHAELLLSGTFSKNLPFGPFLPNEVIEVIASFTNISPDQTITICEGPCIGDSYTFSLGGFASVPLGYSFYFGNVAEEAVFDGQIAGVLLPGEERDFVFGVFSPIGPASPGLYPSSCRYSPQPRSVRCSVILLLGEIGRSAVSFRVGGLPEAVFLALARSPHRNLQPLLFSV